MTTSTCSASGPATGTGFGQHQLAYLRAIAEGLPQREAAVRYLGLDPRAGAVPLRKAHQAVVDHARAAARRTGDHRWRLIGLSFRPSDATERPALDDWAEARGLGEFGHDELLALYQEAFAPDRKATRNGRLRAQQIALLQTLAQTAAQPARLSDRLDAWFPPQLCAALMPSGLLLLSDLRSRIQAGGRWWTALPGIGAGKAERLARHLELLVPGATQPRRSGRIGLRGRELAALVAQAPAEASRNRPALPSAAPAASPDRATALGFVLSPQQLVARDLAADAQAVRAWVRARAGSETTAKVYRRELGRFLLFADQRGLTLSTSTADDCLAYMALLQNVPPDWIGKRTAPLDHAAWSPFAGQLSVRSQQHAVVVVGACFAWLVAARYLPGNPWILVNRRTGDDRQTDELASRALTPESWRAIGQRLQVLAAAEPGAERLCFLLQFLEATGLRAAELLGARLGDFTRRDGGLLLQVHGKGSRNRVIPVPGQAQRALARYLAARGLGLDALDTQPKLPLLASLTAPEAALGYRSLYGSMKTWLNQAIAGSTLGWGEKVQAARASPHWLRHTCGTRALERGVPLDVVGKLLGHADPRTTARYSRAQLRRVSDELEKAFG
jgi:site-specific recombinase XerD